MSDSESTDSSTGSASAAEDGPWPVREDWVRAALLARHGDAAQLRGLDARRGCGAGQAALSDILAVAVRFAMPEDDEEAPSRALRLVVKLPPRDPFSRYFVAEAQFDLREIKFYTEVVPDLEGVGSGENAVNLPVPRCYHAHYGRTEDGSSPEGPDSALLLEDVRPLGYRTASFSEGLTLQQTEAAMEAVARVHALSLVLASRSPTSLSAKYSFLFQSERASDSYQQLLERGLPQLAAFLKDRPGLSNIQTLLEALRPKTRRLIEALLRPAPPMAVITHTDFWCNNLMFREKDDRAECCILDWQMVTLSRPTNDLALLLISSVSGEIRRKHESALLDLYYDRVGEACRTLGEDLTQLGWSRALLDREYTRSCLLALLLCLGSVDVAIGDQRAEGRLEEALQDVRDKGLLDDKFIQEQLA